MKEKAIFGVMIRWLGVLLILSACGLLWTIIVKWGWPFYAFPKDEIGVEDFAPLAVANA